MLPVSGAHDDVLGVLVRLLCDALAVDGQDEVAGGEAAALRHGIRVDLSKIQGEKLKRISCISG